MRRQPHPLAGALRRAVLNPDRRSEEGDTLIEILLTVVVLGLCAVALITTFGTAIAASADYKNLAVNATVLRNVEQTAFYQLQQQPGPLFKPCATSADYTAVPPGSNPIIFNPPTGYTVSIGAVQYWNGTSFGGSCPAPSAPQLITLTVNNPNGSIATTQIAVDGIGLVPTQVTVTAVSPSTGSAGTASLLLTITGTGFETGATVSFPSQAQISVLGNPTFVSPTTLDVFVDLATSIPGPYTVSATNLLQSAVTSTSPLFTVLANAPSGMHVSEMVPNIADPIKDDPDENVGWDAWDTITVESGSGAPLQGVVVNGSWSPVTGSDTTTCTTDSTGTCTVYDGYADKLAPSATPTFTISTTVSSDPAVGGLVLSGYVYTPTGSTPNSPGSLTLTVP